MEDYVILVNTTKVLRVVRWTLWVIMTSVTLTFAVLCFVTACKVNHLSKETGVDANELRSSIIAPFFMAAVVLFFIVVSFILSFRLSRMKQYWGSLDTALVASLLHMVLITLLCVLVMHGFRRKLKYYKSSFDSQYHYRFSHHDKYGMEDYYTRYKYGYLDIDWDDKYTNIFTATFVMGYVSAVMYLVHAVVYVYFRLLFRQHPKTRVKEADEALLEEV